jgi:hypothetical protein
MSQLLKVKMKSSAGEMTAVHAVAVTSHYIYWDGRGLGRQRGRGVKDPADWHQTRRGGGRGEEEGGRGGRWALTDSLTQCLLASHPKSYSFARPACVWTVVKRTRKVGRRNSGKLESLATHSAQSPSPKPLERSGRWDCSGQTDTNMVSQDIWLRLTPTPQRSFTLVND